jgi:hypothetical protein
MGLNRVPGITPLKWPHFILETDPGMTYYHTGGDTNDSVKNSNTLKAIW